jgi:hypothetical protein
VVLNLIPPQVGELGSGDKALDLAKNMVHERKGNYPNGTGISGIPI